MHFQQINGLQYLTFDLLTEAGVRHGIFTRHGGVSQSPWASLNVGSTVGDDPQHVKRNKELTLEAMELPGHSVFDVWQVHGSEVVCAHAPRPFDQVHARADAILTDQAGVTLMMRFADCVPILLTDPVRRVVGIVHAGWQGTVRRVIQAAIHVMAEQYSSRPQNVRAVLGPSIGPDHYVVGREVIEQVRSEFGADAQEFLRPTPDESSSERAYLNLWRANQFLLEQVGVLNVQLAQICTACHVQDWYSHRQERGLTGRFGALVALNNHHQ